MTIWQFVADMVTATPTVLLDLNVAPLNVASYNLSPSDYDKAYASGALMDGARPVHQSATNRVLQISLQVASPTSAGFAGAIENLGRQLAKDNILKYQPNNTVAPVFFRTFANPGYAAEVRGILSCAVQYQVVQLQIEAEFPAYGIRVEATGSPFTVSNDPAAGSNGCFFDVTGVQGDMPTPLLIHATSTASTGTPSGLVGKWTHLGVRRRGIPSNYSNVVQAEAMTQGTGAVVTADATMSGGSKSRIGFGTPTMQLRLSDTFPGNGVSNVEARGEYRVYARAAKTISGDQIRMRLNYGASSASPIANAEVIVGSTTPSWYDMGPVPVPMYTDPVEHGYSGVQMKVLLPFVGLYAARDAGTGSLDVDVLLFVPADDLTVIGRFPPGENQPYAFDGTTDAGGAVYALATTLDEVISTSTPCNVVAGGGFPEAIPGTQVNRIHFVRDVSPLGSIDTLASTTTIRVYYWPRWRELTRT